MKIIKSNTEAQEKLLSGINKLADIVGSTMGAKGRYVLYDDYVSPKLSNDGLNASKQIELEDKTEQLAVDLVINIAEKANREAGDGSTDTIVLIRALYKEAIRNIVAGANPGEIKSGLIKGADAIIEELKKQSVVIKSQKEIEQVAFVSSGNKEISKVIADAIIKVGENGALAVEQSDIPGISSEIVLGMQFDRGFTSEKMITNAKREEAVIEDAPIIVSTLRFTTASQITKVLKNVLTADNNKVVLIAEDISGEALETLILNQKMKVINCLAIKAPGYGEMKNDIIEDIAVSVGAEVMTDEFTKAGTAKKIVATRDSTTIIGGAGNVKKRVKQIKEEMKTSQDIGRLQQRLAKLTGGVAIIKAGAYTEAEQQAIYDSAEDALYSARGAVEEGGVAGGGVAFIECLEALDDLKLEGDETVGIDILKKALEAPIRQIVDNAGSDGGMAVYFAQNGLGFNVATMEYEDLLKSGIVDATKVLRLSLKYAIEAVGTLLMTSHTIAIKEEEK